MEKKQVEDLSNLVFGLALTLGALTLVAPSSDDFGSLSQVVLRFALSFTILVYMWWVYNVSVENLEIKGAIFLLNLALLFLVVIEPFLLTIIGTRSGATAYAIDLGTMLVIVAYFIERASNPSPLPEGQRAQRLRRDSLLLSAALFYVSIVPILLLPISEGVDLAGLLWLFVLFTAILSRTFFRRF